MGKGSITAYVIIGLIIIIAISFVMFKIPGNMIPENTDLSSEKTNTKYYIDTCLDYTTTQAIELFGFNSETAVSSFVDSNLIGCVGNFSFIKDYNIEYGKPKSVVIINKEVVFVDLNFPIEIKKENTKVNLEEFQYSLKRLSSFKIGDVIPAGTTFFSSDKNLVATIEQDTQAVDKRGRNIDTLSFNLLDKNFDGLSNGVVIGNIVYEGLPNGAQFNPPLKITIGLKKQEFPKGYPPQGPQIAWYDVTSDIWRTYPSLGFNEDELYYYYSAEVSHFTPMAIVTCGGSAPEPIDMGYVFRSLIAPLDETYWKNNEKEGFHMIPEVMGNASCYKDLIKDTLDFGMTFNFKGECSELVKDWDKDEGVNEVLDANCLISCLTLGNKYLNCYYNNNECIEGGITSFAKNQNWIFDPYSNYETPLLDENNIFANSVILSCEEKTNECLFDKESVTPNTIDDDENIKTTFEKEPRFFLTPKTYGYEKKEDVGGTGQFIIQLPESGNTCVADWGIASAASGTFKKIKEEKVGICSPGDICSWSMTNKVGEQITELGAGDNVLQVEVENLDDWKAYASGFLVFKGELGITTKGIGGPSDGSGTGMGGELGGGSGQYYDMAAGDFQEIFPGIELKKVDNSINPEINLPRHVIYYVVKIDLTKEPSFFVTPPEPSLMQTSAFLAKYAPSQNLVLAVNGGGFEYGGGNDQVGGYAASSGVVYSSNEHKKSDATVVVSKENEVGFGNKIEAYHAVTGFQSVVLKGEVVKRLYPGEADHKEGYDIADPRTSIGIDEDNEIMYIIVVDGRGESLGVDLAELGEIHVHHGSTHAVNMDGGGSTSLVINQANTALIVNTPSDPGGERAVANHFGVGVVGGATSATTGELGLGGGELSTGEGSSAISKFRTLISGVSAGGQPSAAGFAWLKEQGYTTIIDLSTEDSTEPSTVSSLGMKYVSLPLGGYITESPPHDTLYQRVNYAVSLMDQGNVYVHCKWGVHRTGIVLAGYRIKHGMSPEQALSLYKSEGGSAVNLYPYIFDIILNYPS